MPPFARHAIASFFYPVAVGNRGGGFALDVPTGLMRRAYDVVLSRDALQGPASEWLSARRAEGLRVFVAGDEPLDALIRNEGVIEAIYVATDSDAAFRVDAAKRFGLRVVRQSALSGSAALFPRVTVIIVTHSGGQLVSGCLRALRRNTPWLNLEVIVVDNGSDDGTRVLLATHAERDGIVIISNAVNRGFAAAANQALKRATGEIVVLLNDDTAVGPGWLSRLVAHLEDDPALGIVCSVTNEIGNEAKIPVDYAAFQEMEQFAERRALAHAGKRRSIATVALFCAAARRATLERVGFLDERYAVGMFEDDDLSRTLAALGLGRAIADDSFVHHVGHASFGKLPDAKYLAIWKANRHRFEQKWGVRWQPPTGMTQRG